MITASVWQRHLVCCLVILVCAANAQFGLALCVEVFLSYPPRVLLGCRRMAQPRMIVCIGPTYLGALTARAPPARDPTPWCTNTLMRLRDFSAGAHIHRLGGEQNGVDADHRNRSRRKVAQAAALSVGQFTLTVPRGCCISTQRFDDAKRSPLGKVQS